MIRFLMNRWSSSMMLFRLRCRSATTASTEFTGLLQLGDCAGISRMPINADHSWPWSATG